LICKPKFVDHADCGKDEIETQLRLTVTTYQPHIRVVVRDCNPNQARGMRMNGARSIHSALQIQQTTTTTETSMDVDPNPNPKPSAKRKANDDVNPLLIAAKRSKKEVRSFPVFMKCDLTLCGYFGRNLARRINGNVCFLFVMHTTRIIDRIP
jgi:hypothetical protein